MNATEQPPTRRDVLVNLGLLQLATIGPIALSPIHPGAATFVAWLACIVQLGVSDDRRRDAAAMGRGALAGTLAEGLACALVWLAFTGQQVAIGMPAWVPASWAMIGVSFGYCLRVLCGRFAVATGAGAVATLLSLALAQAAGVLVVMGRDRWIATVVLLALTIGLLAKLAQPPSGTSRTRASKSTTL